MKKVKWTIMTLTIIIASVTAAFTAKPKCTGCQQLTQYYYTAGGYVDAGVLGSDYNCIYPGTVCTYYTTDQVHFTACIINYVYTSLDAKTGEKKESKKPQPQPQKEELKK